MCHSHGNGIGRAVINVGRVTNSSSSDECKVTEWVTVGAMPGG